MECRQSNLYDCERLLPTLRITSLHMNGICIDFFISLDRSHSFSIESRRYFSPSFIIKRRPEGSLLATTRLGRII